MGHKCSVCAICNNALENQKYSQGLAHADFG